MCQIPHAFSRNQARPADRAKTAGSVRQNPNGFRELAERVKPDSGKAVMILITDAVISHDSRYNMPAFYRAIQDVLGPQVIVIGGNAGCGACPVYSGDTVTMRGLVALTISGPFREVKSIVETGKSPISPPLTITKVAGDSSLVELDGKDWLGQFRQYAGDGVSDQQMQAVLDSNGGAWGKISEQYPFALLTEHDRQYVRLSHGLKKVDEGYARPSECYPLKEGDRIVFMKTDEDYFKPIENGMKRLKAGMPAGPALYLLFPCLSNGPILKDRQRLIHLISAELPAGAPLLGFMPWGEHASWYEPGVDTGVCEARYQQLSYPIGMMVFEE